MTKTILKSGMSESLAAIEVRQIVAKFKVEVIWHEEHCPIEGNAGDWSNEQWIRDQLQSGNEWAWCTIEVKASFGSESCSDYLGCCSYKSREDFMEPGCYYDDMVSEANTGLYNQIVTKYRDLGRLLKLVD